MVLVVQLRLLLEKKLKVKDKNAIVDQNTSDFASPCYNSHAQS